MKPSIKLLLLITVVGVFLTTGLLIAKGTSKPNSSKTILWETNLPKAFAEARHNHQPLLLDFYATWCGPCQMLKKITWGNAQVIRAMHKWIPVHLNVDYHHHLDNQYKVSAIPMVVFLKPNGKIINTSVGFEYPGTMLKLMKQAYSQR
jgi:thiol:disulfide interchange protein